MFNNQQLIFSITRTNLKAYLFDGSNKKTKKINELEWTRENLGETLAKIKKSSQKKEIRILLSEDLGYLLDLNIPLNTEEERNYIFSKIIEEIPEHLENEDWDFVELSHDKENKKVRVFAPVNEIWKFIKLEFIKAGFIIEAVETVTLANLRDKDPIVGLGLKKDIRGKDEKVLNINEEIKPLKKPVNSKIPVIIFLLLILGSIVLGGVIIFRNQVKGLPVVNKTNEISITPSPVFDLQTLKIQILEGGAASGSAEKTKLFLQGLEYGQIETGIADSNRYRLTSISIKDSKKEYQNRLVDDLTKLYVLSEEILPIDNNNAFDAIIILGKN